jgi:hypothetical protein
MKKTILKNLLVLCFAFGGLFLIGNNVMARDVLEKETPQIDCPGGPTECQRVTVGNTVHIFYKP